MPKPEAKLKKALREGFYAIGGDSSWHHANVANSFAKSGRPDLLFVRQGVHRWIEGKANSNGLSDLQVRVFDRMLLAQCVIWIVRYRESSNSVESYLYGSNDTIRGNIMHCDNFKALSTKPFWDMIFQ